jgi:hypothetical protein
MMSGGFWVTKQITLNYLKITECQGLAAYKGNVMKS